MKVFDGAGGFKADAFDDRIPICLRILTRLAPASLLDVGCGDGFVLKMAQGRGIGATRLAGLEANAVSCAKATAAGFDCHLGDAGSEFPFDDRTFDVVFAGEVIEHLVDPDAMLSEAFRVLTPGGHLLLTTPNLTAWFNRLLVVFGITPMFVEHSYVATFGAPYSVLHRVGEPVGHLRIFTRTPLRKVLEHNGFECTWFGASAWLPVPVLYQLDRLIARVYPRLGSTILALAKRPDASKG